MCGVFRAYGQCGGLAVEQAKAVRTLCGTTRGQATSRRPLPAITPNPNPFRASPICALQPSAKEVHSHAL